jgi:hypothetical protein
MPVWKTIPVEDQPIINLTCWGVFAVPGISGGEDHHFYGWNGENLEGRVSSKIEEFDSEKKVGLTRSGRHYHLSGESGQDQEAIYVMTRWLKVNRVKPGSVREVTNLYEHLVDSQGE